MVVQALQQVTPGDPGAEDSGLDVEELGESFKFAIDKTLLLYAAGLAAATVGGRLRTSTSTRKFVQDLPRTMDIAASLPRNMLTVMQKSGNFVSFRVIIHSISMGIEI